MSEPTYQAEGLRIAMEMERRGRNLYLRAREFTQEEAFLSLLNSLAEDEKKHYSQFEAMLDVFGYAEATPDEQALAAARAADYFFPGGLMQVAMDGALTSMEAFLGAAMQAERDSISFYGQLLTQVKDDAQQNIILRIIREEMTHLRVLTERQNEIKGVEA